jgi:hypothetical protein
MEKVFHTQTFSVKNTRDESGRHNWWKKLTARYIEHECNIVCKYKIIYLESRKSIGLDGMKPIEYEPRCRKIRMPGDSRAVVSPSHHYSFHLIPRVGLKHPN